MNRLPVYKISIDDELSQGENLGWTQTAFTSRPAIITKGMAFSADEDIKQLIFKDELKYRIAAPAMIPAKIYRNQDNEEFYVEFTEKEIEKIHKKFMKNFSKNKNLFNLEHDSNQEVPAYMLECWLVENPEMDKSFSTYGIKVPKGSLFMVAQITDKDYYHQLVAEDRIGFSIEGFFELALNSEEIIKNNKNKFEKMENKLVLPDGEHTINDKIYVIENGELKEIKDIVKEEMTEEVIVEETKTEEVEMAEVVTEEVAVEAPIVEEAPADYYSKAEVDAKFDELYRVIAELKADKAEDIIEDVEIPTEKSLVTGFAAFRRMMK